MARKKPRRKRDTIIAREFRVLSIVLHVFTRAEKPGGGAPTVESGPWLEVNGDFDDPIRDVRSMAVSVHPESEWQPGTLGPPSIGGIIQFRPRLQAVVGIPTADFDRVWGLAMAGHLKFCRLAFTEPHRRYSWIVSGSFSNKSENEEAELETA